MNRPLARSLVASETSQTDGVELRGQLDRGNTTGEGEGDGCHGDGDGRGDGGDSPECL